MSFLNNQSEPAPPPSPIQKSHQIPGFARICRSGPWQSGGSSCSICSILATPLLLSHDDSTINTYRLICIIIIIINFHPRVVGLCGGASVSVYNYHMAAGATGGVQIGDGNTMYVSSGTAGPATRPHHRRPQHQQQQPARGRRHTGRPKIQINGTTSSS